MAYAGTTSTAPNPPALVTQSIYYASSNVTGTTVTKGVPRTWTYNSTHGATEFVASGFITDGYYLGMKVGDLLTAYTSSFAVFNFRVASVTTTGVTLSTGTVIATS